ncbi:MAG: 50S ribosomal protein L4 [Candidatus Portnoybacteria bacterium]|nr:50S ribosomal protein L4 [Candidatus Portnoybacteria bacterium]
MAKSNVYNLKGEKVGTEELPKDIFDIEIKEDLIYQAVRIHLNNSRIPFAHTKDRSEVRGGGRKPWRQKGTGRARHGSNRSPIWIGGGTTFGPRKERLFKKKMNKKAKRKALFMALTSKIKDGELILIDKLSIEKPKTKLMEEKINNIFKSINKKPKSILILTADKNENIIRASKNIPYIKMIPANSLNILDVLSFKYLLLDKDSVNLIEKTYLNK